MWRNVNSTRNKSNFQPFDRQAGKDLSNLSNEGSNEHHRASQFLGMANQSGKFSPCLAECIQPLRELLSMKRAWAWGHDQERAFAEVKAALIKPMVLALYDSQVETKISTDASSFGLGAVILQHVDDNWRPVAYNPSRRPSACPD